MGNKIIHYIGYYDTNENEKEHRNYSFAARNKMDYICEVLNKIGFNVLIVSPSKTVNNNFYRGKICKVNYKTDLKLFPTLPWGNKLQKGFSIIAADLMLFWYLLVKIKKGQTILVYHSLELKNIVRLAKKIKRFKVILEVEEIYQDVLSYSKYVEKNEYKTIESADKFIFPTELLNVKVNSKKKPHSIIYGTYRVEDDCKKRFDDGKIHVVYAGTFDPRKGGALAATAAAEYLPENYHLHIIGFGNEEEKEKLEKMIIKINNLSKCTVSFDGLLKGEEYIKFLQSCDIGLSTQNPDATFNDTSFPSKILSYMANGLRVVSVRIKAIEMSAIGDKVYFYENQNPEEIARTIMSIDFRFEYNSREIIRKLDENFVTNLKELIEK